AGQAAAHLRRRRAAPRLALLPLLAALGRAVGPAAREAEPAGHLLHHLAGLVEPVDQVVDVAYGHARALGDALPAGRVDDLGVVALGRGHAADDRLQLVQLPVVDLGDGVLHLAGAGEHAEQVADRAHLADGQHLLEEVLEGELAAADLLR